MSETVNNKYTKLVLEFRIPDNMSNEQIANFVDKIATAADELHNGLILERLIATKDTTPPHAGSISGDSSSSGQPL